MIPGKGFVQQSAIYEYWRLSHFVLLETDSNSEYTIDGRCIQVRSAT